MDDKLKLIIGLKSSIDEKALNKDLEDLDGVLIDPRYGFVRVELIEYLTDTYYNV